MKRFIALFLCFILIVLSVGCGKNEPVNADTTTTTEEDLWDDDTTTTTTTTETTTKSETTTKKTETTTKKTETTTKKQVVDTSIKSIKTKEYSTSSAKQIVYYPDNINVVSKPYPVIAWANGTMCPPDLYNDLLIEIAKGGYIVVACDETMAADGTAQRESIDFILQKNNDANDIFYNKVDTKNIGVIGHSQGGRSSVNAATADSRIDCVISLAGSNYDYEVEPLSTPTFFIAGTNDNIVNPAQWIEPAYDIAKGPTVYASLDGAIHTTCCSNPTAYSNYIIDWFDGWLKNDSGALNTFKNGGKLSKDSAWVDFKCKNI